MSRTEKSRYNQKTTDAELLEAYDRLGSYAKVAEEFGVDPAGVRLRVRKLRSSPVFQSTQQDKANRIVQLLDAAKIPVESIGAISKVKLASYGTNMKLIERDEKGRILKETPHTQPGHSTSFIFSPSWENGPEWPVVQPAKPIAVRYTASIPKSNDRKVKVAVVIPDMQVGFLRHPQTGVLTAMHDVRAMEVARQIVANVRPDEIVIIGDGLDFSEMSRWLQQPEFFRTTQPAIEALHCFLATLRAIVPKARIRYVSGNHEKRLSEYIVTNARAAFRLAPANATPESWPDLTLPRLLRFDELKIEWCGEWPGSEAWLVEGEHGLVVVHDPRKKGNFYANVIAGHTHHAKRETFSVRTAGGARSFTMYEIGCLCSLDRNPDKLSLLRTRVPSDRPYVKDWAQGVAVVEIDQATGQHQLDFVGITDGRAVYRGRIFTSKKAAA